jgi:hypothetical protein
MLDSYIIIGTVMAIVEVIKSYFPDMKKVWYPVLVLGLAGLLNVFNAITFIGVDTENILTALSEGFKYGAIAGGIYGLGKAALETDNKIE